MARALKQGVAIFVAGASALQVAPEGAVQLTPELFGPQQVCEGEAVPFEAIQEAYPGVCSVFCVPEGACQGKAQAGELGYLGITGEGSCKERGYSEPAELGKVTAQTVDWLKTLTGACQGMTLTKFQKPPDADAVPSGRICGRETKPYEARYPQSPDACGVFCVPEGECEGKVQRGELKHLSIVGEGNCKRSGFKEQVEPAKFGVYAAQISESLKYVTGGCKGMTFSKFQKPSAGAPSEAPAAGTPVAPSQVPAGAPPAMPAAETMPQLPAETMPSQVPAEAPPAMPAAEAMPQLPAETMPSETMPETMPWGVPSEVPAAEMPAEAPFADVPSQMLPDTPVGVPSEIS